MSIRKSDAAASLLALAGILTFFFLAFTAMQSESDTWDEGLALASDALRVFKDYWGMADYAPPLHTWLNRPWMTRLRPELPPPQLLAESESRYGSAFLFASNKPEPILSAGRLTVLLSVCVMGIFLVRWATRLGGPWAGALAAWLLAAEPTVLAHSRLAVWDALCMATIFIAVYAFWSWMKSPSYTRAAAAGLAIGLALISKYTAALLGTTLVTALAVYALMRDDVSLKTWDWKIPNRRAYEAALMVATAMAVILVSYWPHFKPFEYFRGMAQIYSVNVQPVSGQYQYYLFGEIYDRPLKSYYLVAFLLKTTLPLLILAGLVMIFRARCGLQSSDLIYILMPVIWMFLTAAFDRYNVCIRRVLPVYPFFILIAAQTVRLTPERLRIGVLGSAVIWMAWIAVSTYPNHLSYFNEASGGAKNGKACLDECNVDWGQELPRLSRYLEQNGISEVRMAEEDAGPFGRAAYFGIRHKSVNPAEYESPEKAVYAVSAHRLVWLKKLSRRFQNPKLDWMERYRPAGTVGHSIYVYDFRMP